MNIKDYIESGILELYVAGKLSENECEDVYNKMMEYPEVLDEVIKIEQAIIKLISDKNLRKQCSIVGKKRLEKYYLEEDMIRKYKELYI